MSLTFDSALATTLAAQTSKLGWSNALNTALGATRVLRCRRDANASASNVFVTGTEFINANMTGQLTSSSGNITGFGQAVTQTVNLAADLATGSSVLRIEGNGHYVQGTLGLTGSGADFTLSSNPTGVTGIGFTSSAAIRPFHLLPSGTGPIAPTLTSNAPDHVDFEDWTNPAAPVVIGTIFFNSRAEDLVFEDAEMAAEMGDIAVWQSTQSVVHGSFEFGFQLYVSTPTNAEAGTEPLYQVLGAAKPYGRWASYPAMDTYIPGEATNPPPFKAKIKNAAGTILHTYEMRDGLPVNSPQLSQTFDANLAIRPFWNCAMMLPWSSRRTRPSTNSYKYFNGMVPNTIRPTQAKSGDTINPNYPLFSNGAQVNGVAHMYAMPQWPMTYNEESDPNNIVHTGPQDPNLFNRMAYYPRAWGIIGWDYEIGSNSGHDWASFNGGPRFDRAVVPSLLALFQTDRNYVRPAGAVPIRDMIDAWGLAYFNHSGHYVKNVKTFSSVPDQEIMDGKWVMANLHYGGGPYGEGPSKCVDVAGGVPFAGWQPDFLHAYATPGLWAILLNSPMHAIAAKFRYNNQTMASLGNSYPASDPAQFYCNREQAWRYLHYAIMWKLASTHERGYSRAALESRFQIELEKLYDRVYVPVFIQNSQDPFFVGVRNLGMAAVTASSGDNKIIPFGNGGLAFYLGHTFVMMKQFGLWDAMLNKSVKCRAALLMLIRSLDLACFDFILDTDGRFEGDERYSLAKPAGQVFLPTDVFQNYVAMDAAFPRTGSEDWLRAPDGSILSNGYERSVAMHWRAQYAFARRDYFPEIANPRMASACLKYQGYLDAVSAKVAATGRDFGGDWHYKYPSAGTLKAYP